MKAVLLSIGTELTRGELIDTNAAWLSAELTDRGFDVVERRTVSDDPAEIGSAVRGMAKGRAVLVATGGLGPTSDDRTAQAVAEGLGVSVERDLAVLDHIRRRYAHKGREMRELGAKQADRPAGSDVLQNSSGTAPGFAIVVDGCKCHFLPGVPSEMKEMFQVEVLPRIGDHATHDAHQVHLRTFGLPESEVGERLEGLEAQHPGIALGYRAHFPEIEVKVHARARDGAAAEALAGMVAEDVRARLGDIVFGERDDSFPGAVGDALRRKGLRIAVAESCTGGMIGELLTAVPGSSEYVLLDAVTYSNAAKTAMLGVAVDTLRAYGAVSAETARAMAEGALKLGDADIAVSTTGVAGPGGGSEEKPVGTVWLGLATKTGTWTLRHVFSGDRSKVRGLAAYVALDLIRRAALGLDPMQSNPHTLREHHAHPAVK
jgi:nicotinamide-nucleotide amidase